MIEDGALESPRVDAMFGLHADPSVQSGFISIAGDYVNAASDMFDVAITGSGGHGAYPHTAPDVLYAACQCVSTLQSVVSRNVPPTEAAVVTVGVINAGTARNVIPSRAEFSGIIRTLEPGVRELATRRTRETIEGVCAALGVKADITMKPGYPMLRNDKDLAVFARETASEVIGVENVLKGSPSLGVEDFAYFAELRPACFFNLGVRNDDKGIIHPLHSDRFDIDEDALPVGTAILCELSARYSDSSIPAHQPILLINLKNTPSNHRLMNFNHYRCTLQLASNNFAFSPNG
jgi:amidohydrolase